MEVIRNFERLIGKPFFFQIACYYPRSIQYIIYFDRGTFDFFRILAAHNLYSQQENG